MFRVSFLWPPALRQSNECEMALTQSPVSTRKVQKTLSCLREILILLYFKGYYTSLKNSKAFFISNICRFFPMCFIDLTNGRKFFLSMYVDSICCFDNGACSLKKLHIQNFRYYGIVLLFLKMHFQLPVVHKALQLYYIIYFWLVAEIRNMTKFMFLSLIYSRKDID